VEFGVERLTYIENQPTPAQAIAALRRRVGWNGMEECYRDPRMDSYYHIACYDANQLVGYIDSVSNRVTDTYIQDLMVDPNYQKRGIGTALMNRMIARLKENRIYMISVVYEEKLLPFYRRFGFFPMLCGQMQTYDTN